MSSKRKWKALAFTASFVFLTGCKPSYRQLDAERTHFECAPDTQCTVIENGGEVLRSSK